MSRATHRVSSWFLVFLLAGAACPGSGDGDPDAADVPPADVLPDLPGDLPAGDVPPSLDALPGGAWVLGSDPWGRQVSLVLLDPDGNVLRAHAKRFPEASRNLSPVPAAGDRRAWIWLDGSDKKTSTLVLVDAEATALATVPVSGVDDGGDPRNAQLSACPDGSAWAAVRRCTGGASPGDDCLLRVDADGQVRAMVPGVRANGIQADDQCRLTFLRDTPWAFARVAADGASLWSHEPGQGWGYKAAVGPDGDAWVLFQTPFMRGEDRGPLNLRRLDAATGAQKAHWELWKDGGILHGLVFNTTPRLEPRGADGVWFLSAARPGDPDFTIVPVALSADGAGALSMAWTPESGFVEGSVKGWAPAADGGLWEANERGVRRFDAAGAQRFTRKIAGAPGLEDVAYVEDVAAAP